MSGIRCSWAAHLMAGERSTSRTASSSTCLGHLFLSTWHLVHQGLSNIAWASQKGGSTVTDILPWWLASELSLEPAQLLLLLYSIGQSSHQPQPLLLDEDVLRSKCLRSCRVRNVAVFGKCKLLVIWHLGWCLFVSYLTAIEIVSIFLYLLFSCFV